MRHLLACLTLCLAFASQASGGVIYGVRFETNVLNLASGSSATVNIFFDEIPDAGNADPQRLDLAGGVNGLTIANVAVNGAGLGATTITAAQGNALFDFGPNITLGNPTTIEQAIVLAPPLFGTDTFVRSVLLGNITVTAAGAVGQQNVFTLADFSPADDFIIDDGFGGLGFVADGAINFSLPSSSLTVNITGPAGVPEPSSIVLLSALGGLGAIVARYRKRRQETSN